MKLGVHRREFSTTSVANVLQVFCQIVQWKSPNMIEHRDIIGFPPSALWRSYLETYNFLANNKSEESLKKILDNAFYNLSPSEESCVNSSYRMAQHAALGDVGATKNSETLSAGTSVTSNLTGIPEVIKSGHSTVLPWTPVQDPEVYRSAVKEAMESNELPWEILKDFGSLELVHMDLTFPLRWSFVEGRGEDGGGKNVIHHFDRLCPTPESPQLLHWEAIREKFKKPLYQFRHIVDLQGPTRTVTKIKGCIPSPRGKVIFDIPAALAIANAKINAKGGKRPICSGVSDPALVGIQLKVGDEWIPLAELLKSEEISRLKSSKRVKTQLSRGSLSAEDLMIYSRDIKPGTFNRKPNIDETMPKLIFGYTKREELPSKSPDLFQDLIQYAVWNPDKSKSSSIDSDLELADPWRHCDNKEPPACNCVFTSLKTESGESVDVAVYQARDRFHWIYFPTRQYVFKVFAGLFLPTLTSGQAEKLKKLIVYLEQQCPSGSRSGPWVKVEVDYDREYVSYKLEVEDRQ